MGRVAANFGRLARRGSVPISVAISEQKHNAANDQKARNPLGVYGIWDIWRRRSIVTAAKPRTAQRSLAAPFRGMLFTHFLP